MRKEFAKQILELIKKDKDIYLLSGDIGYRIFDDLREKFPDRFFNLGICEQSMIGIASGMALEGLKPYVYTITPFLIERPFEQVKLDINQQNVNVKLVGYADYPGQGETHSELNWKNISKEFENIVSYFPKNSEETRKAILESYENQKPTIISLKKDKTIKKENQKEKVLVTGGAGYVGSVLVPKLINKGYDVRILDCMWFGSQGLDAVKDKCEIIKGDIRDYELVDKSLQDISYVIHLAAVSNDPCSDLDQELTKQINLEATKNLVKKAKEKNVKRFIFASSSSVYGIKERPEVTEDLLLEPLTIYSKTKALAEEFILQEATPEFIATCIRCATVCGYSPRQRLDVVVNIFTSGAMTKGDITVNGGEQRRPNIHIDDATDLYTNLLSAPSEKISGKVFNYGSENHSLMELAKMVREVIGEKINIIKNPRRPNSRDYHISSEKIKNSLGFYPKKTIKDAIIDLKKAFEQGKLPNPENSIYRNVEEMKKMNLK